MDTTQFSRFSLSNSQHFTTPQPHPLHRIEIRIEILSKTKLFRPKPWKIERDFSAASLVLPGKRGSMDARYFQAQLCALASFLQLVHLEDMSPKSMSAKEVLEALPDHNFDVLYDEGVYADSHNEGYNTT